MSVSEQDSKITLSIFELRQTLDSIEDAQRTGDHLLAMQLAELLGDSAAAILWSATANARTVPGTTWTVIGDRLGITRQAAQQRMR